MISRDDKPRP